MYKLLKLWRLGIIRWNARIWKISTLNVFVKLNIRKKVDNLQLIINVGTIKVTWYTNYINWYVLHKQYKYKNLNPF